MDVVSTAPLRVASLLWRPSPEVWSLTVVCKATYLLQPMESPLALDQDEPHEADSHWDDDEVRSLHAASDLAPFKPRADVFLVGHAFAPDKRPVRSLRARLVVGEVDKSIEVFADRSWTPEGRLHEGPPFAKMPLRWERAGGGPETRNPVGVRPDAPPDTTGMRPTPNMLPRGVSLAAPGQFVDPIGFGPIAPTWPERVARLNHHAAHWSHQNWSDRPLPLDMEGGYFNAAPMDQQLPELLGNERLVLENLHSEHVRLLTRLQRITPRAVVERPGRSKEDVLLRCDTLCIDTDRGCCTLTWRGGVRLSHPTEAGRVTFSLDGGAAWSERDESATTQVGDLRPKAALPFTNAPAAPQEEDADRTMTALVEPVKPALPFAERSSPWSTAPVIAEGEPRAAHGSADGTGTLVAPATLTDAPATPFSPRPTRVPRIESVPLPSPPTTALQAGMERVLPSSRTIDAEAPYQAPPRIGPLAGLGPIVPDAHSATTPADRQAPAAIPDLPADPSHSDQAPPTVELTVEQFSAILAELAEQRLSRSEVFHMHGLTDRDWEANERRWTEDIKRETARGTTRLRSASDSAYVTRVEGFRGPITLSEYTRLVVALERSESNQALDDLHIQRPALMRIIRLWTKNVACNAKLAEQAGILLASMRGS